MFLFCLVLVSCPNRYSRLGLARVGLPAESPLDPGRVEALLKQQGRVVVYFSLALLLAPVVETLVLLDRMIFLQENGERAGTAAPPPCGGAALTNAWSLRRCGQSAGSALRPELLSKKLCARGSEASWVEKKQGRRHSGHTSLLEDVTE